MRDRAINAKIEELRPRRAGCLPSGLSVTIVLICVVLVLPAQCYADGRVRILIIGNQISIQSLRMFFDSEPGVTYHAVPARNPGGTFALSEADLVKMIRLYFPRSYEELKTFDVMILTGPDYNLFTTQQDRWMYEGIREGGMGGINDMSVFSIVSGIAESWSASLTQRAFPNDAPAVTAKSCGESPGTYFRVVINRQASFPILTAFIPFGVEDVIAPGGSRMVIHREGSEVLAWQVGNFGSAKIDYIAAWEYGDGRTITNGNGMAVCWQGYPRTAEDNQYSPEILMNMMYWLAKRNLIDDIAVFHRVKGLFAEYSSRLSVLLSLMDFADKFGANTEKIQREVTVLNDLQSQAIGLYLKQDFAECEKRLLEGVDYFPKAEEVARREKDKALFWVYVIEWLVTSSTLFLSGALLWTLMIRRKLYREVDGTKLRAA